MFKRFILCALLASMLSLTGCGDDDIEGTTNRLGIDGWTSQIETNKQSNVLGEKQKLSEYEDIAKEALKLCNEERTKVGLSTLKWDGGLYACADVRAEEASRKWSHTRPNGKKWWTVNKKIMYGENLAYGYSTAEEAVKAWMESDVHRDNILYEDFTKCGISVYKKGNTYYWAQEFGY